MAKYFCRCNVVVNILENAHKLTVTENICDDCQSAIMEVQFKVHEVHIVFKSIINKDASFRLE